MGMVSTLLDHAIEELAGGRTAEAARWAVALLKSQPESPGGLYLAARILAEERPDQAPVGYEAAARWATDRGDFPLAAAACRGLADTGADAGALRAGVASTFAAGSPRLDQTSVRPPAFPTGGDSPKQATGSEAEVIATLADAAQAALTRWEEADLTRPAPPPIAPEPLFSELAPEALKELLRHLKGRLLRADERLIQQGEPGSEAYFVARGELEVWRDADTDAATRLARLGAGALVGEMALLSRAPRAACVVAKRPSVVLVATKAELDAAAGERPEIARVLARFCRQRMMRNLLHASSLLATLPVADRARVLASFETCAFEQGDTLIEQATDSKGLHLVASGMLQVLHRSADDVETLVAEIGVGEVVGEVSVILHRPSTAAVVAAVPTITLHLSRDEFLPIVRQHPDVFAKLYELAVHRVGDTSSIVAATHHDDATITDVPLV